MNGWHDTNSYHIYHTIPGCTEIGAGEGGEEGEGEKETSREGE